MLQDSEPITANSGQVIEILVKAGKILFGVGVDDVKIPEDLWRMAYVRICEQCVGMTIQDVRNAFNEAHIEKKEFRSLTRDELIAPILAYHHRKQNVLNKLKEAENQVLEQQNEQQKVQDFKNKAIERYKLCLSENRIWDGDEFESNVIAKEQFADRIDQKAKDVLWLDAQREYKERRFKFEESTDQFKQPPPASTKIFSRMIVELAASKGLLIIEE